MRACGERTVRLGWLALMGTDGLHMADYVLNRVAFCLFFTTFSLVLFWWYVAKRSSNCEREREHRHVVAHTQPHGTVRRRTLARIENYHKTYVDTAEFLPLAKRGFIGVNILVYCVLLTLISINIFFHFAQPTSRREEQLSYVVLALYPLALSHKHDRSTRVRSYNLEIVFFASINLLLAIAFLFYGWQMTRKTETTDGSTESVHELRLVRVALTRACSRSLDPPSHLTCTIAQQIIFYTSIICVCFALKCAILCYRPLTGNYMNTNVFFSLGYYIPEIIPSLLQMLVISRGVRKVVRLKQSIDDLYEISDAYQRETGKTWDEEEISILQQNLFKNYYSLSDDAFSEQDVANIELEVGTPDASPRFAAPLATYSSYAATAPSSSSSSSSSAASHTAANATATSTTSSTAMPPGERRQLSQVVSYDDSW